MSDPYGDPLPPRHGEDEEWRYSAPVCPICGGLVRAEILARKNPDDPARGAWKCDLHGEVMPEWVYPDGEEDDREEE